MKKNKKLNHNTITSKYYVQSNFVEKMNMDLKPFQYKNIFKFHAVFPISSYILSQLEFPFQKYTKIAEK